ncbi:hypothetical protein COHA_009822 [Chlorella ohadii]|uniref:Uncharacterized protein n=1 Tax=Chlorella ohadii TaxID=2649997 RepID=A0AAD5GXS0_9CHLO|nr:hypothetical protein COHA_009822 [Chlorella ohadii]
MLQQAARRAATALFGRSVTVPAATRSLATAPPQRPSEDDDDAFELLPPGCSLKDPTYGRSFGANPNRNSLSDPVMIYDSKPVDEYRPLKKQQPVPAPPLNVAAAQAKLQESKDAKKKKADEAGQEEEDEDFYVYLPPGSSMRDPVSLPNSMSDPLERRVFYRDPKPTLRKS